MTIELRQLRVLAAVADAGGLTQAAARLGIPKAKLEQRIWQLERSVGTELVYESPAGTAFTEAGEILLEHASVVLSQFDRMLAATRDGVNGPAKLIRIGAVATPILPQLIQEAGTMLPGTQPSLRIDEPGTHLAEALLRNELDIVVLRKHAASGKCVPPPLEWSPVATEQLFVGIPKGHALGTPDSVVPSALSGHRCVLLDPSVQPLTRVVLAAFAETGADPRFSYATSEWAALCLGRGARIPTLTVLPTAPIPDTTYRPLCCAAATSTLVLAWRPGGPIADCAARLCDALRQAHADCLRRLTALP